MFEISPTGWTAIWLTLRVALVATLVATPLGIGVAWLFLKLLIVAAVIYFVLTIVAPDTARKLRDRLSGGPTL